MTDPASRVFGLPPGADGPRALVAGLRGWLGDAPPEAMARVTLFLNSHRMKRRVEQAFQDGTPGFLPRMVLVTEAGDPVPGEPMPRLARQLQLTRLVAALIEAEPDLAAPGSAFDLAGGLVTLIEEAQRQAVPLEALGQIDVGEMSAHWARSRAFLDLVAQVVAAEGPTDATALMRARVEAMIARWQRDPPADPVVVAGCTGSRGTTAILMQAVTQLPRGALVLPGFDAHMPADVWRSLTRPVLEEDHPQSRYATLFDALGIEAADVRPWAGPGPDPARDRLVSLSLRPAPVTDGWLRDGPGLGDLVEATKGMSLIEAPDPRAEAMAIALSLRAAADAGRTAALISPDRVLTRRVAAALDRWRIEPDDSAGEPLAQTATGRLLRHVAGLMGDRLTAEALIVLLKNPRVAMGRGRGDHLRHTRALEVSLRKNGPAFPDAATLAAFAAGREEAESWAIWVMTCLTPLAGSATAPLADHLELLKTTAMALAAGPAGDGTLLWSGNDGEKAGEQLDALAEAAPEGGEVDPLLFGAILRGVLTAEVRDPLAPHPGVLVLGTQEARVQTADLVILGGLVDGIWPPLPAPDPWLNRAMRRTAGLPLPERRIGLSAHDYQQAIGAREVVLSRALRGEEADTVPSRWLNRLTNLLSGLPAQGGDTALAAMRDRGRHWVDLAAALETPVEHEHRAPRPSPAPPVRARPRQLSVTEIETLLRDPYQIYAKHVLRLKALPPLRVQPEAALRGTVLHEVLNRALPGLDPDDRGAARAHLMSIGAAALEEAVPWPAVRRFWLARLDRIADGFLDGEATRRARAANVAREAGGGLEIPGTGVELTVKTDRIDRSEDGLYWVYDYKSGSPPTAKQQREFSKQLHITAWMLEAGAFDRLAPAPIAGAEYIGLGSTPKVVPADFEGVPLEKVRQSLTDLIRAYQNPAKGYTAHVARETMGAWSDYDHLSRGGEWTLSEHAVTIPVGYDE